MLKHVAYHFCGFCISGSLWTLADVLGPGWRANGHSSEGRRSGAEKKANKGQM